MTRVTPTTVINELTLFAILISRKNLMELKRIINSNWLKR
jgi:hypothetical protein